MIISEEARRLRAERWPGGSDPHRGTTHITRSEVLASSGAASEPQLDEALQESESRLHALLGIIPDFIFIVRKDGVVVRVQSSRTSEFFLSADEVVGRKVMEMLPTGIAQQAMHYVEKTLRTGATQFFHCQFQVPGGLRDFEARIAVWSKNEVVALVRDVADRRILQKEILEISQRERNRIGQDLHDGLGQHLTGITFLSKALQNKLQAKNLPEAREAGEIGRLVIQALTQTRSLARGLFPVELEAGGLKTAFKELATTAEQLFQISCTLDWEEGLEVESNTVATHLFRLAQEAVSNSVKHGKSRLVTIAVRNIGEEITLTIADNGSGIGRPVAGTGNGLGLRIMNYRAQKIGGTLEIGPGPSGGTIVRCTFHNRTEDDI